MEHEHEASYSWNKETSGIEKIVASKNTSKETSYSLQGMLVTNPTKGIYIKNGKKIIIK